MKKWVVIIIASLFTNILSQTNVSPQFSELKGMKDQLGNTHLFYRIYSHTENFPIYSYTYNDVYHLDLSTLSDSLFLRDYIESNPVMFNALSTNNFKFWNNSPNQFIYVGMIGGQDPVPFIRRFDQEYNLLNAFCCEVEAIDISTADDSLLFAGGWLDNGCIRSIDGGFNWSPVVDSLQFLSLNPINDNILFLENYSGFLYRSTDAGNTFNLVDLLTQPASSTSFLYDPDQSHIYRLFGNKTLRVSSNQGEQFSWQTKYSGDSEIFISVDESISGTIYLADKKNILVSTDYGDNFNLYIALEDNIVGVYKKPDSDLLYAATTYRIYQINLIDNIVQIIKSITPVTENYGWYPMSIGNYWVYGVYTNEGGSNIYWGDETKSIIDIPTSKDDEGIFIFRNVNLNGTADTVFIKLDSLSGKLYAYSDEEGEYLFFDDLSAEAGDTVCYVYNPAWNCQFVQLEREINEFGLNTLIKEYYPQAPGWYFGHSLVKGIGLFETYNGDLNTYSSILKGCIINGVVYGDTTTVGVGDEENPIATEFRLDQNYPNPFNPITVIGYRLPVTSNVTLKVYDILGNEIATLVNEEKTAGEYEIDFSVGRDSSPDIASGIYFYQLSAGDFVQSKKMVLLK